MRSIRRLSKIATKRQQRAQKAKPVAISITWDMSAVEQSSMIEGGKPTAVRIGLNHHKPDHAAPLARMLEVPGSELRVIPDDEIQRDQPAPRGRRLPPTPEEQAAALKVLRARARRGEYVGFVPRSGEEVQAEHARRAAELGHARMLRTTARPSAWPEAKNPLSSCAWGER